MLQEEAANPLSVFDSIQRTDNEPKLRAESRFTYLNRSGTVAAGRMRNQIDLWYAEHPADDRYELRQRLRSGDEHGFDSAFQELVLNALARALGCKLCSHPDLPGTSKHPDFVVRSEEHGLAYMEAVSASEVSRKAEGAENRTATLLDGLDRLETDDFFVGTTIRQRGTQAPSARRLRSSVDGILRSLEPTELAAKLHGGGLSELPRFPITLDDWVLDLTVMPKSKPGGRLIGIEMTGVQEIDTTSPLRAALKRKAGRYGELDSPYVIAINTNDMFAEQEDVITALYGTETLQVTSSADGHTTVVPSRVRDGLWLCEDGPQNTRVSAVMFTRHLTPANLMLKADARLYLNPWASRPYFGELGRLDTVVLAENSISVRPGRALREVLKLDLSWPGWD